MSDENEQKLEQLADSYQKLCDDKQLDAAYTLKSDMENIISNSWCETQNSENETQNSDYKSD